VDAGGVRGVREGDRVHRTDRRGALALSRYCLDTSAYSYFKRDHPRARALIEEAHWLGVPTVVLGELWAGFLSGTDRDRNETELETFLVNPVVEELPVDRQVARTYAEIASDLRAAGTPVPSNDVWIAATSASAGAPLLTFDAHFKAISRIGTILLEPEPA
jgi:tRNA(fMet)-specific endonuclease VapC